MRVMVRLIHVLISASFWRATLAIPRLPNNSLTETVKSISQLDCKFFFKNLKNLKINYRFFVCCKKLANIPAQFSNCSTGWWQAFYIALLLLDLQEILKQIANASISMCSFFSPCRVYYPLLLIKLQWLISFIYMLLVLCVLIGPNDKIFVQSKTLPANGNCAWLKTMFRVVFQLGCGGNKYTK